MTRSLVRHQPTLVHPVFWDIALTAPLQAYLVPMQLALTRQQVTQ